jgi:hypothetical protein
MKSDMKKGLDNNVKRAVKVRLELYLIQLEQEYKHYQDFIKHRLTPTRQAMVERAHKKKITALRIVLYMCTPHMERDSDIPNLFTILMPFIEVALSLVTISNY